MPMKDEVTIWAEINAEMPDASWEQKYAEFKVRFLAEQIAEHQAAISPFEDRQMASLNRIEALLKLKFGLVDGEDLPNPPEQPEPIDPQE